MVSKNAFKRPIVLAAGGTGGHVFPALSVAMTLQKLSPERGVVIMTDQRTTGFHSALGVDVPVIRHTILHGKGRFGVFFKLTSLFFACLGAFIYLLRCKPAVVVGFGGYPSLPAVIAAHLLRIPVLLHEQNAVLGRTNRWVARLARGIALSFTEVRGVPEGADVRVTGNPVRSDIMDAARTDHQFSKENQTHFRVLVVGGSQGAAIFSTLIPPAILALEQACPDITVDVVQQCREALLEKTAQYYEQDGSRRGQTDLRPFIDNMAAELARADLIIARAGASTLAEITVVGRPSVLIPYRYALDNHQAWNAAGLVNAGGSVVFNEKEVTADQLTAVLQDIFQTPGLLQKMADAAKSFAHPDAPQALCRWILELSDESA